MQIDRLVYPIKTLGPGQRIVIWTIGCPHHCYNCANPELWDSNPNKNIKPNELFEMIKKICLDTKIDGITITGGEPFIQDDLPLFLSLIRPLINDILVYTGYNYTNINHQNIDVIIDGLYLDSLNDNQSSLIGSSNQRIIYLNELIKPKYLKYLKEPRATQNIYYEGKLISIGIPNKFGEG